MVVMSSKYYYSGLVVVCCCIAPTSISASSGVGGGLSISQQLPSPPASVSSLVGRIKANGRLSNVLTRSIPALNVGGSSNHWNSNNRSKSKSNIRYRGRGVIEVSTKTKNKKEEKTNQQHDNRNKMFGVPKLQLQPTAFGTYYGIVPSKVFDDDGEGHEKMKKKKPKLSDTMTETLEELRLMREELTMLRKEMRKIKTQMSGEEYYDDDDEDGGGLTAGMGEDMMLEAMDPRNKRIKEYEKIGKDVESWAKKLLFDEHGKESELGWQHISCNKMCRKTFNRDGRTTAYLKWIKDSRGPKYGNANDNREYPIIKIYSTIDAPIDEVSTYLSQPQHLEEYNDLVINHRDLETFTETSKITWGQSPPILFIKSRDFVTYCSYRWTNDGNTQIMVNQACDHPDVPANNVEEKGSNDNNGNGKVCRALAIRGANFISRDPDDPEKTRFAMLAHGSPGGDIPQWASKTAINAVAPIEPFKLFHKINVNVQRCKPQLQKCIQDIQMVNSGSSSSSNKQRRPGGMAQLGFACFWPQEQQQQQNCENQEENGETTRSEISTTTTTTTAEAPPTTAMLETEMNMDDSSGSTITDQPTIETTTTVVPIMEEEEQQQQQEEQATTLSTPSSPILVPSGGLISENEDESL